MFKLFKIIWFWFLLIRWWIENWCWIFKMFKIDLLSICFLLVMFKNWRVVLLMIVRLFWWLVVNILLDMWERIEFNWCCLVFEDFWDFFICIERLLIVLVSWFSLLLFIILICLEKFLWVICRVCLCIFLIGWVIFWEIRIVNFSFRIIVIKVVDR